MSKFYVGEVVVLASAKNPDVMKYVGEDVMVSDVGSFQGVLVTGAPENFEYEITTSDGMKLLTHEFRLRKRRPPEERGSWVDVYAITGWMPLEHARTKVCQKN